MSLVDSITGALSSYATKKGVTVKVASNILPTLTVYKAGDAPGILAKLGIVGAVQVEDSGGHKIMASGDPPPFDPLRAALVWGVVGLAGFFLVRGILKGWR